MAFANTIDSKSISFGTSEQHNSPLTVVNPSFNMIRADSVHPEVWEAMCTPMHEIIPATSNSRQGRTGALYLGSWAASVDSDLLETHHIRAIVEAHDSPWGSSSSTPSSQNAPPVTRYRITIPDSSDPDVIRPHLEGVIRYIREKLSSGQNVLVHCQQGVSRSAALVVAYLMHERGLSYDSALRYVRSRRRCVRPNSGFERTLRAWEKELGLRSS